MAKKTKAAATARRKNKPGPVRLEDKMNIFFSTGGEELMNYWPKLSPAWRAGILAGSRAMAKGR